MGILYILMGQYTSRMQTDNGSNIACYYGCGRGCFIKIRGLMWTKKIHDPHNSARHALSHRNPLVMLEQLCE